MKKNKNIKLLDLKNKFQKNLKKMALLEYDLNYLSFYETSKYLLVQEMKKLKKENLFIKQTILEMIKINEKIFYQNWFGKLESKEYILPKKFFDEKNKRKIKLKNG